MSSLEFVNAHAGEWSESALNLTRDYFDWMDKEIQKTCSFSISDVVGMPLDQYITTAAKEVCPTNQSDAKYYLLVDGKCAVAMGGLRILPGGDSEVVRIYTKPEYRGRGIAKMMLRRLISDATQRGFKTLKINLNRCITRQFGSLEPRKTKPQCFHTGVWVRWWLRAESNG